MKRSKFGLGILLALLVLGAVSAWMMVRLLEPVAETVGQAGEAALRQDWSAAEALSGAVRQTWDRRFPFFASFSDHEPMEEINGLFAQLEIYARSRDPQNFAAICAQLAKDLEAMGEAHSLKWWNLL